MLRTLETEFGRSKRGFMRTSAPSSVEGIEKYLASGMIRGSVRSNRRTGAPCAGVSGGRPSDANIGDVNCNTCARRKGLLQMNTKQDINRLIETLEGFRGSVSPHVRQSLSYVRTCYN